LNFAEENLELVLEGMLAACSSGGTAYPLFAYNQEQEVNLGFVRDDGELSEKGADLSVEEKIKAGMIACKTGTAEFGGADERGYRKTHAWLTGVVGVNLEDLGVLKEGEEEAGVENAENANGELGDEILEIDLEENSATDSANLSENDLQNLRQQWLEKLEKGNFPEEIVITVLVESDDEKAYREGSDDAAPVVTAILDWMRGE
jgi:cell division protein FtsI/penicillin-binding protein 2